MVFSDIFLRTLYLNRRTRFSIAVALGLFYSDSYAQETQNISSVQTVEVSAPDPRAQRRVDTAAKIIITRDEILQYGDSVISDALKRQPGISVVGTELRMRGLGAGYTQIMVNGEPIAPGFTMDNLSPDLIERIEIMRTTTAEFSAQAIAGTINIILRKGVQRASKQLKFSVIHGGAGWAPTAAFEMADKDGRFSYSLNANLDQILNVGNPYITETNIDATGNLQNWGQFYEHDQFQTNKLSIAPRLNWTLENSDQLSLQSLLELSRTSMFGAISETTLFGEPSTYPQNDFRSHSDVIGFRTELTWSHRFNEDAKLDSKLAAFYNKRSTNYFYDGYPADDSGLFIRNVISDAIDENLTANGKFLWHFNEQHSLALGWNGALIRRSESRLQIDNQADVNGNFSLDQDYRADVRQLALFVQDEWDVSAGLQAYLGLRWEGLDTVIEGSGLTVAVGNRSGVFSPVAQLLWKLPDSDKDQLRFALGRTYKAPTTRNLVPRRYTVNNDNSPTNSDFQGNPHLLPELAWGFDVAYEHYFAKNSLLSISGFTKRIQNVTTFQLFEEEGEWVSTPANQGNAKVYGVEMDAKFPLVLWLTSAPPVDIHMNAARNWSFLDSIAGPDNRLANQIPVTANIGLDYRRSDSHSMGMNLNFQNGGRVQASASLSNYTGVSRTLDLYSLWKLKPGTQLRLSIVNALHQSGLARDAYVFSDQSTTSRITVNPKYATVKFLLETAL